MCCKKNSSLRRNSIHIYELFIVLFVFARQGSAIMDISWAKIAGNVNDVRLGRIIRRRNGDLSFRVM